MTQFASDNFTRADNASLGVNWTVNTSFSGTFWAISSNNALAAGLAVSTYTAVAAPNDGYAEITIGSLLETASDNGPGPCYRTSRTAMTLYFAQANTTETKLYKLLAGAFTQLGSDGPAVTTGDVIRLICNGTSLTVTKNGISIITATDASIASGDAGMWASPTSNSDNISLFAFGDLNAIGNAVVAWIT